MIPNISTLSNSPHVIRGSLFAISGFFFMAAFGVVTKLACLTGEAIWISFITYLIAAVGTAIFILPQGKAGLKSGHYPLLIARATIGTVASFLYMISMHYISVVNATLLFNTAPIFIPLLSYFVLKVSIGKNIWYAVILGFIGILAIIKPGVNIFTDPGNLIALASGISLAIAYLCMKLLTETETGLRIVFYYFTIGMIMQLPLLYLTNGFPSIETVMQSTICGILLLAAQMLLVKAYQYAAASQVGVFQYTSIVFVAIMEWLFWSKTPGMLDILGFALVSIAGIFIISTSRKA